MHVINRLSLIWTSAAVGYVGIGLVFYSSTIPYYTDGDAPRRLLDELKEAPDGNRSEEWYARLPTYETGRKALSDWGRGCMAASLGFLCAILVWHYYHHWHALRTWPALLALLDRTLDDASTIGSVVLRRSRCTARLSAVGGLNGSSAGRGLHSDRGRCSAVNSHDSAAHRWAPAADNPPFCPTGIDSRMGACRVRHALDRFTCVGHFDGHSRRRRKLRFP